MTIAHYRRENSVYVLSYTTVVRIAPALPNNVVTANKINTFKNRLDKFWEHHRANITGIGNRSIVVD